jgi:hypothetical protein
LSPQGAFTVFDSSTPVAAGAESLDLVFIPPEILRIGNREQRVGVVVYRLLQTLFGVPTHEAPVEVLELKVWGRSVNRNTLWSACRRARGVLIKLDHPLRVALDGDRIALV